MTKYNDTMQQPPPVAATGAVGNAFMAGGLLVVVSFILLLVTDTWRSWWALRAVLLIFAVPILFAAGSRLCLMVCQVVYELERYTKRDINRDGSIGDPVEKTRIIPVYGGRFVDEVDVRDLAKFVEVICATGKFTQRDWQRYKMPSGRVVDNEYHARLIAPLTKLGFIIDRSERSAGRLIERNPDVIKDKIGIS